MDPRLITDITEECSADDLQHMLHFTLVFSLRIVHSRDKEIVS